MRYRRVYAANAAYFFTVNLADRSTQLLTQHFDALRTAMRMVHQTHPFKTIALVVLPDHLHAIWQLPVGDAGYPMRWSLIKAGFSRALPILEAVPESRRHKRERGIWQRRYWEHLIRDDTDLQRHVDYIHINPVKHGYVKLASEWPYSTLHRYIRNGWSSRNWGTEIVGAGGYGE